MFWIQLILVSQLALADSASEMVRIDAATEKIMSTSLGGSICRHILGADAKAIQFHLGVSPASAAKIATGCANAPLSPWIYPSSASVAELRKLTARQDKARKYVFVKAENDFPVESWTDPFSNTTVIVTEDSGQISDERLTQLLAHELGVYFDAKATPAHPDAKNIPELRDLEIKTTAKLNPLVAVSNPLNGHTLTYLRALQVEYSIMRELKKTEGLKPPANMKEPYLLYLVSDYCGFTCLRDAVKSMREAYFDYALPLIAYSPHYRSLITDEIKFNLQNNLTESQKDNARDAFNVLPPEFLSQDNTDAILDFTNIFIDDHSTDTRFRAVSDFMRYDLWRLEEPALLNTTVGGDKKIPFLVYMKQPLLSGYNILMSSGPRVRIRTGNIEGFYELIF